MSRDSDDRIVYHAATFAAEWWYSLSRFVAFGLALLLAALAGCAPDYSPNTYSAVAMQQAEKVDRGVIVGYREVKISASGAVGAVAGGAAGGILGAQSYEAGVPSALGAVGGTLIGGLVGTAIEHTSDDTTGWEYIVRLSKGDLLSVTQRQPTPLALGQKVLVITGKQARIVPDYSVDIAPPANDKKAEDAAKKHAAAPPPAVKPAAATVPATAAAPAAAPASATATTPAAPAPAPAAASSTPPAAASTPNSASTASATSTANSASTPSSAPTPAATAPTPASPSPTSPATAAASPAVGAPTPLTDPPPADNSPGTNQSGKTP
jgi:outer membrane lipoprotein SlyB